MVAFQKRDSNLVAEHSQPSTSYKAGDHHFHFCIGDAEDCKVQDPKAALSKTSFEISVLSHEANPSKIKWTNGICR